MASLRRLTRLAIKVFHIYVWRMVTPPAQQVAPQVPDISVETTNLCNAKCVFCANPVMERKKEPLDWDLFTKAIDEFIAMGGTNLNFNVVIGDPLLDKDILKRGRYVKQFPQITENGFVTTLQWLHRFDLDELFEAGFTWISVSTTLSGRQSYADFFGVDKYDQMLQNLLKLLEENDKRGEPLIVLVGIKPTPESVQSILNHPDYQRVRAWVGPELDERVHGRSFFVDDWLGTIQLPKYLKKRPLYPRRKRPCRLLYKGLMLYSNGNVGACACRDFEAAGELILGNVEKDSLEEIWEGEKLTRLRSDWRERNVVPEICKSCSHYLY